MPACYNVSFNFSNFTDQYSVLFHKDCKLESWKVEKYSVRIMLSFKFKIIVVSKFQIISDAFLCIRYTFGYVLRVPAAL